MYRPFLCKNKKNLSGVHSKNTAFFAKTQGQISKTQGVRDFKVPLQKVWAIFGKFKAIFEKVGIIFEKLRVKLRKTQGQITKNSVSKVEKLRVFAISVLHKPPPSVQKKPALWPSC